jgi:hypothetical protein
LAAAVAGGAALTTAAGALLGANTVQALVDKQDKIHTFSLPINYDDTSPNNRILSINYDTSLALDASGSL